MTRQDDLLLGLDKASFEAHYNRTSYGFSHVLNSHPLFALDSILDLAARRRDQPALAYWSSGNVGVVDSWATGTERRASLQDTIEQIAINDSLVMFRRVEMDPKLGPTIRSLMARLVELGGARMRDDVAVGRGTLLVASPRRITSYHIDADTNFLFQIRGNKMLHVFDAKDRTLVTHLQLEQYFCGDPNAAKYPSGMRENAIVYDLHPGAAVHIPSGAPHWAQNMDDVSIALSINYDLRSVERIANIFRVNRRLRRFGISPVPPETSAWRDELKLAAGNVARRLKRYLHHESAGDSSLR